KEFIRETAKAVPSPQGKTVYDAWKKASAPNAEPGHPQETATFRAAPNAVQNDVPVGDLGSGSDYSVFLQHLGVPSTDIGSTGSYGVYHSAFDNFNWFKKFADPDFVYEQQMARIFGLSIIRMADVDVLPYDYEEYAMEIVSYIESAKKKATAEFVSQTVNFADASQAAHHFEQAAAKILVRQQNSPHDPAKLNRALRDAERALLMPEGLPNRPWFRHAIYAPGQYTGYAAVV